jgi:thiol-disulfide isomerase/thioredoxin
VIRRLWLFLCCAAALLAQVAPSPLDEAAFQQVLQAHKGKVVLFDFWATWCEPCRVELPLLVRLEAKYRSRGLKLITISCDEPEQEAEAAKFLQQHQVPPPAYIKRVKNDDKFIESVDAQWSGALPALFLYDRQGRKVKSYIGETDMAALEAAIRKLL